jgi:hypothetical protein
MVSPDGHHLVVWGGWPTHGGEYREEAFSIYEDGKPIKRYEVRDLVVNPEGLPHSVSHYEWVENSEFDGGHNWLMVRTVMGEKYTFDVATGDVVSAVVPTSVAVKQKVEATVMAERVDPYDVLYLPRRTPSLSIWAVLGISGISFACLLGGVEVARKRSKRRRDRVRVQRVVWRIPVERG